MADTQADRQAAVKEASAAAAEGQQQVEQLRRQQRELQLLVRQIETEQQRLLQRYDEREERVRAIETNPDQYQPAEIKEAYATLSDVSLRQRLMQMQLEALRQREQWLGTQCGQLQRFVDVCARLSELLASLPVAPAEAERAERPAPPVPPSAALARRVVDTREEQNQRLARQIQDSPMQALSNLVLQAEVCQRLLARNPERARTEMQGLKEAASGALAAAHRFIAELQPPTLVEMGLLPTLRRHVTDVSARTGVPVGLQLPGQESRLPARLELALFRIAEEGLRCVFYSPRPRNVAVSLALGSDTVTLTVDSVGGTDQAASAQVAAATDTIRTYAEAVEGQLTIHGPDARGVHIRLEVQLASNG